MFGNNQSGGNMQQTAFFPNNNNNNNGNNSNNNPLNGNGAVGGNLFSHQNQNPQQLAGLTMQDMLERQNNVSFIMSNPSAT